MVVFLVSVVAWWLEALAMPLIGGRDFGTYLGAYVELFQSDPIDLGYVLGRTPVAPLVVGALLDPFGGMLVELGVSALYGMAVTAWFLAARTFGGRVALAVGVVLLLYPSYAILFHELASDSVFGVAFAGWSLLAVRVLVRPSPWRFALLGGATALLVLVRPGNQALLVLALVPLALGIPWRARLASAAAFATAAVLLLGLWTVHNGVRFGDYTVARGGNSRLPFERAFLFDRIVRPENGPSSRRLAEAVERELLPKEPYRSYGIGLDDFFSDPSPRMKDDLGALANQLDGWKSDERLLRDVGVEAVRAHPGTYARGVSTTIYRLLRWPIVRPVSGGSDSAREAPAAPDTIVVNGHRLPRPTEGERIPSPHFAGPTSPDGSIYAVWTSPSEHHLVFVHPGDEARYVALHRRMDDLAADMPDRDGSPRMQRYLNLASRGFPPPVVFLALGIVGLLVRKPDDVLALTTPAIAAVIVVVLSALAIIAIPYYSVPAAPAFLLLAAGSWFAPRVNASRR